MEFAASAAESLSSRENCAAVGGAVGETVVDNVIDSASEFNQVE